MKYTWEWLNVDQIALNSQEQLLSIVLDILKASISSLYTVDENWEWTQKLSQDLSFEDHTYFEYELTWKCICVNISIDTAIEPVVSVV